MRGYDEQYNCLVRYNVYTDLNSARAVNERNRELRYLKDYFERKADRTGNIADDHQYDANLDFISDYEDENMITVEEDAKEHLARYFKDPRFGKLRKKLDRIRDRSYAYRHLKDLAIVIMPDMYWKFDMFSRYEEFGEMIRDNYLGVKAMAQYLGVSESSFRLVLRIDYVLDAYFQENILKNVRAVENTLYKKALVDEDTKSLLYILSNRMPEKYSGEYSADINLRSDKLKEVVDAMSVEEMRAVVEANLRSISNIDEGE